nr:hypothetical protein [Tanacetum cinerariifolium]
MELCIKLSDRFLDLEKTKTAQAKEIANFKKKVKKLERKRRYTTITSLCCGSRRDSNETARTGGTRIMVAARTTTSMRGGRAVIRGRWTKAAISRRPTRSDEPQHR